MNSELISIITSQREEIVNQREEMTKLREEMAELRQRHENTCALLRETQIQKRCMTEREIQCDIAGLGAPVFSDHDSPLLARKRTASPAARPFSQNEYRGAKRRRVVGAGGQGRGMSRPERCFMCGESRGNLYQHFRKVHKELSKRNFACHYSTRQKKVDTLFKITF